MGTNAAHQFGIEPIRRDGADNAASAH
jgi:hypothetical protein